MADITFYRMLWYFIEYSFIGWMVEVIFHAVVKGKIVNRGFLNGPVCPVYGCGMAGVIIIDGLISDALSNAGITSDSLYMFAIFIGGALFATVIELIAGWALDVIFHARW